MQSDNVTADLYYSLDVKSVIKEIITTIVRPGNEDEEYQIRQRYVSTLELVAKNVSKLSL